MSQEGSGWHRSGFLLRWNEKDKSSAQDANNSFQPEEICDAVELCCWGSHEQLMNRFERMAGSTSWRDVLQDPMILLEAVVDELFLLTDRQARNLHDAITEMGDVSVQPLFADVVVLK